MKKAIFSLVFIFGVSIAFANLQDSGEKVRNPKTTTLKGPKYKNRYSPARASEYNNVSEAETSSLKGPEYKNNRTIKASDNQIKIKKYNSKGPKYKFDRFHN